MNNNVKIVVDAGHGGNAPGATKQGINEKDIDLAIVLKVKELFDEAGDEYYEAYEDKEIQQIAWSKYGFRTGVTGGNYDVTQVNVKGIPQSIISTVSSLKMNVYEQLISYLGNK